jgi:hypothetical protein
MPELFVHRQRLTGRLALKRADASSAADEFCGEDRSTAAPRRLPSIIVLLSKRCDGRTVALGPSKSSRVNCQATDVACSVDDLDSDMFADFSDDACVCVSAYFLVCVCTVHEIVHVYELCWRDL